MMRSGRHFYDCEKKIQFIDLSPWFINAWNHMRIYKAKDNLERLKRFGEIKEEGGSFVQYNTSKMPDHVRDSLGAKMMVPALLKVTVNCSSCRISPGSKIGLSQRKPRKIF